METPTWRAYAYGQLQTARQPKILPEPENNASAAKMDLRTTAGLLAGPLLIFEDSAFTATNSDQGLR